jgi:hypothetical protein
MSDLDLSSKEKVSNASAHDTPKVLSRSFASHDSSPNNISGWVIVGLMLFIFLVVGKMYGLARCLNVGQQFSNHVPNYFPTILSSLTVA